MECHEEKSGEKKVMKGQEIKIYHKENLLLQDREAEKKRKEEG